MTRPPILLAEDEAMLRVIAVEMLEDAGFQVYEAGVLQHLHRDDPQHGFVFGQQDGGHAHASPWSRGIRMVMTVPLPGAESIPR